MINLGIVGYGNLGRGVIAAVSKNEDMKLAVVFTRRPDEIKKEIVNVPVLASEGQLAIPPDMQIDFPNNVKRAF